jgi:hypothetical protein
VRYLRSRRRARRSGRTLVTAGFFGGVVAGLVLWSLQMARCKRDLFSTSPVKRLAALGYLGGQPSLESVHLLTEYLGWEKHPLLRRRAERLLQRMKARVV